MIYKTTLRNWLSKTAILVLICSVFWSCEKDPNNIGIGIQPDEDFLTITSDSTALTAELFRADSIVTSNLIYPTIGNYFDPVFGQTNTVLYSQFELPGSNLDLGNPDTLEIDSVVLQIQTFPRHYGSLIPQEMLVQELGEDLYEDSTYFSNESAAVLSENLIEPGFELVKISNASLFTAGDSALTTIRIRLKNSVGQNFIDQYEQEPLEDDESFQEFFKGLAISSIANEGGIISTFPSGLESGIAIYYKDNGVVIDTLERLFPFNNSSPYNLIEHDYTTAQFGNLTDPVESNDLIFIQGVNGTMSKVELPDILMEDVSEVASVSRAELIIPVLEGSTLSYDPPSTLYLLSTYTNESSTFIRDVCSGLGVAGAYDADEEAYVFNISLHLADILSAENEAEFWISPNVPFNITDVDCEEQLQNSGVLFPVLLQDRRVILCGPEFSSQDTSKNMRLLLTYGE